MKNGAAFHPRDPAQQTLSLIGAFAFKLPMFAQIQPVNQNSNLIYPHLKKRKVVYMQDNAIFFLFVCLKK